MQKVWYRKLKEESFKDIENTSNCFRDLKISEAVYFRKQYSPTAFEEKQRYYELASHFLHSHTFENPIEEEVWKCHSEGLSVRETARILSEIGFLRMKYVTIHLIISRLKKIMLTEPSHE